jgi:hypothetical protein
MPARQLCSKVNLKITGVDFVANLIVLEFKGIDVILGMDWLSKYMVLIDCAKKYVKMTTPEGKEMVFIVEPMVTTKGVANCTKVNQLDASQGSEVPVVNEFPDVFPKVLSGMPPDRDIEFVIELKPGTSPIYKTPYRMAILELAKLKEHISAMALNSTHPERGTSLILYLGVVVMPRCSSRARSLLARTGASIPKDSTSSASWYIFSSSASLGGVYSSLALSSISWSFGCCCSTAGKS